MAAALLSFAIAALGAALGVAITRRQSRLAAERARLEIQEVDALGPRRRGGPPPTPLGPSRAARALEPWTAAEREALGINDTEAFLKATQAELNRLEWARLSDDEHEALGHERQIVRAADGEVVREVWSASPGGYIATGTINASKVVTGTYTPGTYALSAAPVATTPTPQISSQDYADIAKAVD